jgi:DNA polymerase-3 subunit gamma/tau
LRLATHALAVCALLATGCPTASSDAPPPVRKPEIPTAPPHARGALAAGTDGAPRPEVSPPGGDLGEPDVPSEPAPAAPEGSAAPPEEPEAPAPAPTAPGMAL